MCQDDATMTAPLLSTKLYIPRVRPGLVSRPRLIERLNAGLLWENDTFARKLTIISAPAGFGKTTLLAEWVQDARGKMDREKLSRILHPSRVAWLSLGESDNDATRFWAYFVTALQTVCANVGETALETLKSPQAPPAQVLLTALINEIAEIPDSFLLVLDDYHVIVKAQIHDALAFLLDNLPRQMHLVVSGRSDPPWPLAREHAAR